MTRYPLNQVEVSEERRISGPLRFWLGLLVVVSVASYGWANLTSSQATTQALVNDQDARIRKLENNQIEIAEMRRDLKWLREREESRDHWTTKNQ